MVGEERETDVLILSSAIGSGHMRASAALVEGVRLVEPGRVCQIVDFPHEVSPGIERMLRSAYLECLKLWPAAYGMLYQSSTAPGRAGAWQGSYGQYVEDVGIRALEKLRSKTGAKALVAPHFYGAGVLGGYKKRNPEAFTAVVLTDYLPHPIGVPPNLDLYVVADESAAMMVASLGVPEQRIHPTGIPIDPIFEEPVDAGNVREDLLNVEDDDLPIVLVMGGGLGGGDLERTVSLLWQADAAMHLTVLCGSNDRSREQLEWRAEREGRSATFLAFTDQVRELMAAASVLVTKPGGMSCTEALSAGLPQILYHPIPGQEVDNAAAIERYGAGVIVGEADHILGETMKLLTSRNRHSQMVESARAAHRPNSARSAAELILAGIP